MNINHAEIAKKLAMIAIEDDCSVELALERALNFYLSIQTLVWKDKNVIGVVDTETNQVLGLIERDGGEADAEDPFEFDV